MGKVQDGKLQASFYLDREVYLRARARSVRDRTPISRVVENLLREYLRPARRRIVRT